MFKKLKTAAGYFAGFDISTLAAGTSFFMILSIFPLLMLVLSLLRYLPWTLQDLLNMLSTVLPDPLMGTVGALMRELYTSNLLAVVSVTVLVALWSASRGVFGIINGINTILGADEHRSYVRRRLTAILYTFLMIIALFLTLGLQVFGRTLLAIIDRHDIRILEAIAQLIHQRNLFTTALLTLLFTAIYAFFPAKHIRLRHVLLPALLTAVGWLAFSYLFSIYVDYGGGSRFYGSMTTVILGMLWLYICMYMLFLGGVLSRLAVEGHLSCKSLKQFFFSR